MGYNISVLCVSGLTIGNLFVRIDIARWKMSYYLCTVKIRAFAAVAEGPKIIFTNTELLMNKS